MTGTDKPIRVIVVEDEPVARRSIQRMLEPDKSLQVIAACSNGEEAVEAIRTHRPDLLFLDVQMPGMDGFSVLKEIHEKELPLVIFTTAYEQYAVQAFEIHAVDYLLKPFGADRLRKAVEHARELLRSEDRSEASQQILSLLQHISESSKYRDRVAVKENSRIFFLDLKDIEWIKASGNYLELHGSKGEGSHLIRQSLAEMEMSLNPRDFVRINRSLIVNIHCIRELQPWFHGDCRVLLTSGKVLTLSRRYRDRLQRIMEHG
jgi:two-component system LytT family response regulator